MNLTVDIQTACTDPVPEEDDIRGWIEAALVSRCDDAEISVRLVGDAEMSELNQRYRGKAGPTNVLSFPADLPGDVNHPHLGDIVVCAPVVRREAHEQHKSEHAHWGHMLVHGSLHLLGYDHVEPDEAEAMETLETAIMGTLGFACPYGGEHAPAGIGGMA